MTNIEKLKNKSILKTPKGGARVGAGRKKGGMNSDKLEKYRVMLETNKKIQKKANLIVKTLIECALGRFTLHQKINIMIGNKSSVIDVIVTDNKTIKKYKAGKLAGQNYYSVILPPDTRAAEMLLDRAFGRPVQPVDLEPEDINSVIETLDDEYNTKELGKV